MKKSSKLCYVVLHCGKTYYVVVGHLDEFVSLYLDTIGEDDFVIATQKWHSFDNPLSWYDRA